MILWPLDKAEIVKKGCCTHEFGILWGVALILGQIDGCRDNILTGMHVVVIGEYWGQFCQACPGIGVSSGKVRIGHIGSILRRGYNKAVIGFANGATSDGHQ